MNANQLEGAGATFGQVIGRNPQVILAYARMSVIEHRMGRTAGARHNLKAAHFIVSSSMYGLNAVGTVGLEDGREEEAFHYFQQAFNLRNILASQLERFGEHVKSRETLPRIYTEITYAKPIRID